MHDRMYSSQGIGGICGECQSTVFSNNLGIHLIIHEHETSTAKVSPNMLLRDVAVYSNVDFIDRYCTKSSFPFSASISL